MLGGVRQIASVKAPTGKNTSTDAELFAIQLAIAKDTATGYRNIVVFTDNFPAARGTMDTIAHSGQDHSLAGPQSSHHRDQRGYHMSDTPSPYALEP